MIFLFFGREIGRNGARSNVAGELKCIVFSRRVVHVVVIVFRNESVRFRNGLYKCEYVNMFVIAMKRLILFIIVSNKKDQNWIFFSFSLLIFFSNIRFCVRKMCGVNENMCDASFVNILFSFKICCLLCTFSEKFKLNPLVSECFRC